MPITYPYDILASFPGWSTEFDLLYRQEQSRTAGGKTYVKDLGSPLWQATYMSRSLPANVLDAWRARLKLLEGGLQEFLGRPISRCFPIAHPNGLGVGDASSLTLGAIGEDRKTLRLSNRPAGYSPSIGDYLQLGPRNLHQIGNINGLDIEVRPHFWPETVVGNSVTIVRPSCRMTIVPGSISTTAELQTGRGSVSFQAIESR
ncbi:hypothetical protein ABE530_04130 [Brucella sp. TWI559]